MREFTASLEVEDGRVVEGALEAGSVLGDDDVVVDGALAHASLVAVGSSVAERVVRAGRAVGHVASGANGGQVRAFVVGLVAPEANGAVVVEGSERLGARAGLVKADASADSVLAAVRLALSVLPAGVASDDVRADLRVRRARDVLRAGALGGDGARHFGVGL